MRWRRAQPALRWGEIEFIETNEPVLAFIRRFERQALLVMSNLGTAVVESALPAVSGKLTVVEGHGLQAGSVRGDVLRLPGHGASFAQLDRACFIKASDRRRTALLTRKGTLEGRLREKVARSAG